MDYLYIQVEDVASILKESSCPYRRKFGKHLEKVSKALHDIEWVDSADYEEGDEIEAIKNTILL